MMTLFARVTVKPGQVDKFLHYLEADVQGSLAEPGCLRFDVARDASDPHVFLLYEVYRDEAAYEVHARAPYFRAMFEQAGETLAAPPEGHRGTLVLPREVA